LRKLAVFFVVALAAIGVAFAVLPFHLTGFPPELWRPMSAAHCSAPIVSAFRTSHSGGGWFGYAPLTNTPIDAVVRLPNCKAAGQRRLQYAGMFVLAAAVIAIAMRRSGSEASDSQPDPTPGRAK
jgi:hypothetical protein